MNLVEAITICFKKYATFSGRASRTEFWWFHFTFLTDFALFISVAYLRTAGEFPEFFENVNVDSSFLPILQGLEFVLFVSLLAFIVPSISSGVRRMHDGNHSGWWLFVPIVNLVFLASKATDGSNNYGDIAIEQL
jgi:uncharacterized membrane protein YhaH (DUF805 family)